MPTITTGVFFVARTPPQTGSDGDGFKLTLRVIDRAGRTAEAYQVVWHGEEAAAWWAQHAATVRAGTPLRMELLNPHSMPVRHGAPEIHATVRGCQLAPEAPSWQANRAANPATTQPHAA
jgi:hypothetical protein